MIVFDYVRRSFCLHSFAAAAGKAMRIGMLGALMPGLALAATHHHEARARVVSSKAHTGRKTAGAGEHRAARGSVRAAGHARAHTVAAAHGHFDAQAVVVAQRAVSTRLVRVHGRLVRVRVEGKTRYSERFLGSSFTDVQNLTVGDVTAGEDATVRAAAIDALGNMNGTALAIDPATGRILAMVNQHLALSSGAEPCSTIKLTVALAALEEGLITKDTPVSLGGGYKVDLTYALAKSINPYFEALGRSLGFERVKHYANQFGLGELAGYNIAGEQLGIYPDQELSAAQGGVGRMCSFGESVSMTPLQLGAIVSAIANGGTLYYLQHPTSQADVAAFQPRIKRTLDIGPLIPEMLPGMSGAVSFGTARRLRASFTEFPVFGKTGTCSNNGTRFGWFGSYADTPRGRIVTVIFLEGGRPTFGPKAAELTGQFYRSLYDRNYFATSGVAAVASTIGTR